MKTLRDRNRDINEAFQASQNGLSQKMGEFFDAMYHNASIANSTGAHGLDKKSAVQKNSLAKQDSNHLTLTRELGEGKIHYLSIKAHSRLDTYSWLSSQSEDRIFSLATLLLMEI